MRTIRLVTLSLMTMTVMLLGSCQLMYNLLGLSNPAVTLPAGTDIAAEYDLSLSIDPWSISADELFIPATADKWYKITVPSKADANYDSIWGSNPYSGDSVLAVTALHSGAITTAGGVFYIKTQGSASDFYASTANGVSSQSWDTEWDTSYIVYKAP